MSRAASVPAESDLLCEGCGYVINGLPEGGRCPECGKPLDESTAALRRPPAWERAETPSAGCLNRFSRTTADCVFRPTSFFRTLSISPDRSASRQFARLHWGLAAVLFGLSGWTHYRWIRLLGAGPDSWPDVLTLVAFVLGAFLFLAGLNRVAAALTTYEATFRGIRLPLPVVLRGLDYHAAYYLPVALFTAGTVLGYSAFLSAAPSAASLYGTIYLYTLCGGVVVAALYLFFKTYWIAMRNLMYANRE